MINKHTPGPWAVNEEDTCYAVYKPNNDRLGTIYICKEVAQGKDDGLADATLIAAAPDLLEALEGLMSEIDKGNLVRDTSQDHKTDWQIRQLPLYQSLSRAATAIAKARGL